jgi:acyl carrier protein
MNALVEELKRLLIESLDLEDIEPQDIDSQAALFGEGLGLDSIDALELGVAIQKRYGLKIEAATEEIQESFYSIATLAEFVAARRTV